MGDGGLNYFLILIFVFWVLEAIAKARRRAQFPEEVEMEMEEAERPERLPSEQPRMEPRAGWPGGADASGGEPGRVSVPGPRGRRSGEPLTPRDFFEELAEITRGRVPVEDPPAPQPAPPSTGRPPPPPRAGPVERTASTRWEKGSSREPVIRTGPPVGEERRSERWMAGKVPEVPPVGKERISTRAARTPRTSYADARLAAGPRRSLRESRLGEPSEVEAAAVPGRRTARGLRGASREELQRLFVLREVLGPPVALRDEDEGGRPS